MLRFLKPLPLQVSLGVNPSGKFVWLQKLAESFLMRYGTKHVHQDQEFVEYVIDTKHIVAELNRHRWIAEEVWGKKCEYLVLGHDMMTKFMMEPTIGMFTLPNFRMGNGMEKQEIMGLKVILVPYINGFFALPKL